MGGRERRAVVAALLLAAGPAQAQEVLSARPTLYVGADDAENGNFATTLHLGVTARTPEFWRGVSLEGELSLLLGRLSTTTSSNFQLTDNSSYVRLRWRPAPWGPGEGLSFTFLPLSAERLYLGDTFPTATGLVLWRSRSEEVGADLRLERASWLVFVSLKSHLQTELSTPVRRYTVLGGGEAELLSTVRLALSAAYSDQGQDMSASVQTLGVAGRLLFHHGPPVGAPVDYARSRWDPLVWENALRADSYPGGLSTTVSAGAVFLAQAGLSDPKVEGATSTQPALAADLEGRVKWDALRLFLRGQLRTVSFLQNRVPSYPPYTLLGPAQTPEVGAFAAMDYSLGSSGFTPGLGGAVVMPATLSGEDGTLVLPDAVTWFDTAVLPSGAGAGARLVARATLRWDSRWFAAVGEATYTYDPNAVLRQPKDQFGFHVLLQARFGP